MAPREITTIPPSLTRVSSSRAAEIETLLPVFAQAAREVEGPFVIPVPSARLGFVRNVWSRAGGPEAEITDEAAWSVLQRVAVAAVCSGTATLEAALARTPFVLAYRLSPATVLETKLLRIKRPKFFGLPNIILDRLVVPELLQDEASPARIAAEMTRLRAGDLVQSEAFEELDQLLGPADAIARTAATAAEILNS
ncbi:MAG: hypothetical protein C4320_06585 [Armatimonadota bacterium]